MLPVGWEPPGGPRKNRGHIESVSVVGDTESFCPKKRDLGTIEIFKNIVRKLGVCFSKFEKLE